MRSSGASTWGSLKAACTASGITVLPAANAGLLELIDEYGREFSIRLAGR